MGYLRCESCGAKALSAASQCPKCASPFNLLGARGDRVALKKCSSCGIMHRRDKSCHWCGDVTPAAWRSPVVLKSASGIAAVTLLAIGSWSVRDTAQDVFSRVYAEAMSSENRVAEASTVAPSAKIATAAPLTQEIRQPASAIAMPDADSAAGQFSVTPSSDSIRWEPAVARTWVNVRSDASRGGDVVGVIKPDERAMLGVDRAGWRQVRLSDVSGWVDPRLFESDSLRTRG